jgi:hypothetical protein
MAYRTRSRVCGLSLSRAVRAGPPAPRRDCSNTETMAKTLFKRRRLGLRSRWHAKWGSHSLATYRTCIERRPNPDDQASRLTGPTTNPHHHGSHARSRSERRREQRAPSGWSGGVGRVIKSLIWHAASPHAGQAFEAGDRSHRQARRGDARTRSEPRQQSCKPRHGARRDARTDGARPFHGRRRQSPRTGPRRRRRGDRMYSTLVTAARLWVVSSPAYGASNVPDVGGTSA